MPLFFMSRNCMQVEEKIVTYFSDNGMKEATVVRTSSRSSRYAVVGIDQETEPTETLILRKFVHRCDAEDYAENWVLNA